MKSTTGIGEWIASSYEASVPFLQQVPRDCADYLLLNAQIREYDAGEIIVQGGVEGEYFCVMQSGRAQVCGQILPDGTCRGSEEENLKDGKGQIFQITENCEEMRKDGASSQFFAFCCRTASSGIYSHLSP